MGQEIQNYTVLSGERVHLNQLVEQDKGDWKKGYVVTEVGEGYVKLNEPDFEGPEFTVDEDEWEEGGYEAATSRSGGPIWGY